MECCCFEPPPVAFLVPGKQNEIFPVVKSISFHKPTGEINKKYSFQQMEDQQVLGNRHRNGGIWLEAFLGNEFA